MKSGKKDLDGRIKILADFINEVKSGEALNSAQETHVSIMSDQLDHMHRCNKLFDEVLNNLAVEKVDPIQLSELVHELKSLRTRTDDTGEMVRKLISS